MKCPQVNARVRLRHDVPDLSLPRGTVGVVCTTWFAPALTYEVEFASEDNSPVRVLLEPTELEMEDDSFVEIAGEPVIEFESAFN